MRNHPILIASLIWCLSPTATASVEASTLIRQYDDGQTKVTSPSAEVEANINHEQAKIGVGWSSDIVSSASSDVRTFGSRGQDSKISDRRVEYSANTDFTIADGNLGFGYIQSDEKSSSQAEVESFSRKTQC